MSTVRVLYRLACGHTELRDPEFRPLARRHLDCSACQRPQRVLRIESERLSQCWMDDPSAPPPPALRRKSFAVARDLQLTRDERLELAGMITGRDIDSWSELTHWEAGRVLDAMTGHQLIAELRRQRQGTPPREASGGDHRL